LNKDIKSIHDISSYTSGISWTDSKITQDEYLQVLKELSKHSRSTTVKPTGTSSTMPGPKRPRPRHDMRADNKTSTLLADMVNKL